MSFLNAEWRKLAIANYQVDPRILSRYIPAGTELDFWQNTCFVSLVGFMFVNTKLLGVKIPFHTDFEEVNLRFYVRRFEHNRWKRGVVFIKEIVPKPAISFLANTLYNENYETCRMQHIWEENDFTRTVSYRWKKEDMWQSLKVTSGLQAVDIEENSEVEFITEHYWGYAKVSDQNTNEYEVTHPRWKHYQVEDFEIKVDFKKVYGNDFALLNDRTPDSVMLAEGSQITVEGKTTIKTPK